MRIAGWLTGTPPTGGSLRGAEFQRVRSVLAGSSTPLPQASEKSAAKGPEPKREPPRNVPLAQSDNDKARDLVTLDEKFLRDVATMPPAAASYVRRHPCLSLALMEKWRDGHPYNPRSDFG